MTIKYLHTEQEKAYEGAKEMNQLTNSLTFVMIGTDNQRSETFIEVYTDPFDSTIVTGKLLATCKKGKIDLIK